MLIHELKQIQHQHGYLPREELAALSKRTSIPLYALHGVASFYPHFRLEPPPPFEISVCTDLSCHMRGGQNVIANCKMQIAKCKLNVDVKLCSCLGQCDRAPALSINGENFSAVDEAKLDKLFAAISDGKVSPRERMQRGRAAAQIGATEPYALLQRVLSGELDPLAIIQTMKDSGLRGMGGAGFPCGAKWEIVRNAQPGPAVVPWWDAKRGFTPADKYVICNADESEPGTFKDRDLLRRAPHLVIEGMIIAALVVGASEAIVFIRHEYYREHELLEREVRRVRKLLTAYRSLLTVSVFESPGGYICGEETALLEALEGKRAEPRNKPPFPGTHGLFGKPTVINNVETFAWVPAILHRGGKWFNSQGVNGGAGLKYLALSGDVRQPGVYEVPLGIKASDFISEYGGGVSRPVTARPNGRESPRQRVSRLKAFMPGGASSGFLPASMLDVPLEFRALAQAGSMLGSGAVVAIAEGRCMLDLALNVTRFFRNESCGKCVPCREGSQRIVEILERARRGEATNADFDTVNELAETMQLTSICGLGQAAPLPITSVLKYFKDEVDAHILEKKCPAGVCFG